MDLQYGSVVVEVCCVSEKYDAVLGCVGMSYVQSLSCP